MSGEYQDRKDMLLIAMAETLDLLLMHATRMELGMHTLAASEYPKDMSIMAMKAGELRAITERFKEAVRP